MEFSWWKAQGLGNCPPEWCQGHGESEELQEGSQREPPPPPRGKELSVFKRPSSTKPPADLHESRDRCKREILIMVKKKS